MPFGHSRDARVYGRKATAIHNNVAIDERLTRKAMRQAFFLCNIYRRSAPSVRMLEVSLLGVGTVLRLERDAWSMVKSLRRATNEYVPPLKKKNTDLRIKKSLEEQPDKNYPVV